MLPFFTYQIGKYKKKITSSSVEGFGLLVEECLGIWMHAIYRGAHLESGFSLIPWGALMQERHLQIYPTLRQEASAFCTPGSNHWQETEQTKGGEEGTF